MDIDSTEFNSPTSLAPNFLRRCMFQGILIRYGEIALKSPYVRRRFEDILMQNIRSGLKAEGLDFKVNRFFGRLYIEGYRKKAERGLKKIFGVVSFSPVTVVETDLKEIKKESLEVAEKNIKKSDSFEVDCNRAGKHGFTSQDVERLIGAEIVKKIGCKVNLTRPDKTLGIDIRENKTFIFCKSFTGPGGIPIGAQGKVVSIIEDFNGVVASWMLMKRGCVIIPVFIGKGKGCMKNLEKWHIGYKLRPYFLTKYSGRKIIGIAKDNRAPAIVTGESSLDSRKINYTAFRPVVGLPDKYIEKLKKQIRDGVG